jgi:capsular polysaccharide biosynthesis protein
MNGNADDLRERLWAFEDFTPEQEHPGFDVTGAFASFGYVRSALRRGLRIWLALGIIGLLAGGGLYVALPPAYQATTSVFLTHNPNLDPLSQAETDQALLTSRTVASRALAGTGLREQVSTFQSSYTATIVTNQVLQVTVHAKTSAEAVAAARSITASFLAFRAGMLQTQQQQQVQTMSLQVNQAQQQVDTLNREVRRITPATPAAQASKLTRQLADAQTALANLQTTVAADDAQSAVTTSDMVNGSKVLDAATALPRSKFKYLAFDVAGGLVVGLALGMAFIVLRALVTDRLRRRADIATALGAPVRLSVGSLGRRAPDAGRRVVQYLGSAIPPAATLAIVAVDNVATVAELVSSLARWSARDSMRVVVADLTPGARAARLLGARDPGVTQVMIESTSLTAYVPDPHMVAAGGPLRRDGVPAPEPAVATACHSADLLVTFAVLDPAIGAEHLATWATDAVAVVTAGRSSGPRLYAVGEMIRLSGTRLVSAVLLDADPADVSIGVPETLGQPSLTTPGG